MCAQTQQAFSEGNDMVRDMDLVRDILRTIEQDPEMNNSDNRPVSPRYFGIEDDRSDELRYDLRLLIESKFVHGSIAALYEIPPIAGLTWDGHELIADISSPDIWEKTKEQLKKLPGAGIGVAWEIAKAEIRKKLGL